MRTLIAIVASLSASAHAQVFEVVTDTTTADLDTPGGERVLVSLFVDVQGATTAPWDVFNGWASYAGLLAANGGAFELPVEVGSETSGDPWRGRRPPSTNPSPGGSNGGFRFLSSQTYIEGPGSDAGGAVAAFQSVLSERTFTSGLEGLQASNPLGGFNQNTSERLEVFRADLVFDRPGTHTVRFHPLDAAIFDDPSLNTTELGVQGSMTALDASVNAMSVRPFLIGIAGNRDPLIHGKRLKMTIGEAIDQQDDLIKVRFFRDSNQNGRFDNADQFLGRDNNGSNGWEFSALSDGSWGTARTLFFAEPVDSLGNRNDPVELTTDVLAPGIPYIQELTVESSPNSPGSTITLRARGAVDTDGSIQKVRFFRDADGNGRFSGGDVLVAVQNTSSGFGYDASFTWDPLWTDADQLFFAQAVDDVLDRSLVQSVTVEDTGESAEFVVCPGDRDGDGWVGASDLGSFLNDYANKSPGADIDGTPGVDQMDLIMYIALWEKGCG